MRKALLAGLMVKDGREAVLRGTLSGMQKD